MALSNVNRIIRAPGRLVVAPTNLSAAFPYGGKELGNTKLVVLSILGGSYKVNNEALGEITDVLDADKRFVFSCFIRGWDDDALQLLFADQYVVGSATGHAVYEEPGLSVPGSSAVDVARKLLFVPYDTVNVPALIMYRAVPDWGDNAQLVFNSSDDLGLAFAADLLRDASNRILKMGRLADLTL